MCSKLGGGGKQKLRDFVQMKYRSTIVGSCKNNSQIKNRKEPEIMDSIKQISENFILGKKQINGNFGLF